MIKIENEKQLEKYFDEGKNAYIFKEDGELTDVEFTFDLYLASEQDCCGCEEGCDCEDEKCHCGSDCDCGCQDGKPCTCGDEKCSCDDDDDCGCGCDCEDNDDDCGCGCDCEDDECNCGCSCEEDDADMQNDGVGIMAHNIYGTNITCGYINANDVVLSGSLGVEQSLTCSNVSAYEISGVSLEAGVVETGALNTFVVVAKQIFANNIDCIDVICNEISVNENILACNIIANTVTFNTFCIAKENFKVSKMNGQRKNNICVCLDKEIVKMDSNFAPYNDYINGNK